MGHGHFSPSGTRRRFEEIVECRGCHVEIDLEKERFMHEEDRRAVIRTFTDKYSFNESGEWVNNYEKVVAETRHGVELRTIYHPTGTTVYYYLVVTKDTEWGSWDKTGLAMQHLPTYEKELRKTLQSVYGAIYRKTSAYTSEKIEVKH